jgi:hypothetical protein
MTIVHAIWRAKQLTAFGLREQIREAVRAEQEFEAALKMLASMLSECEYQRIAAECERGERQVRLENGFVMMTFSPRA